MKKIIRQELNNKLLLAINKNWPRVEVTENFKLITKLDYQLIKNLIRLELFLGQRPRIMASYLKKELIINLRSNCELPVILPLLQKSPITWKEFLEPINLFEKGFFFTSLTKAKFSISFKKLNSNSNWIKSAYLD